MFYPPALQRSLQIEEMIRCGLWASHAAYLNDRAEVAYGHDLVLGYLEALGERELAPLTQDAIGEVKDSFDPLGTLLDAYVACFCSNEDLLGQWRGYGGDLGGYALGLDPLELRKLAGDDDLSRSYILLPVIYSRKRQVELIKATLDPALDLFAEYSAKASRKGSGVLARDLRRWLAESLLPYLVCFEGEAFAEEQEWRLIHYGVAVGPPGARLLFRPGRDYVTPYLELDISLMSGLVPLKKVMCGPSVEPDLTAQAIALLLRKQGYDLLPATSCLALRTTR